MPDASDWETISVLLDSASSTYSEPWDDATCRTLMKGGYLGNGDFGAHLGGTRHSLKYYLGKNGFHAGNDVVGFRGGDDPAPGPYKQHILNLAIWTIEAASGMESGSAYRVTQDLRNAEIRADCTMAGAPVLTRAYLSASSNALVLELSTNGGADVRLQATLSIVGNQYVAKSAGTSGEVIWVTKEPNAEGAPFYVKGAVAARVLGATSLATTDDRNYSRLTFTLPANGGIVRLFLQAEHTKNAPSPLAAVLASARDTTEVGVADLSAQNRAWWKQFWLRSYIHLDDEVQRYWYNHLYMIGSAARSGSDNGPGKAPGHWGPWNRTDDMKWFGNLGMNYNAQNPYYGTFAANHIDLVDPYIQTIKYYAENTARKRVANRWVSPEIAARMPANCRGVQFEGSFTAHGTPSTGGGTNGSEDCCMATNAVFGILPLVWKWKYGQDRSFLSETCYPLMQEVTDFFDDYIGKPVNGRYDVYGSVHEGANWFAKNDMFSLGAMRFLYREIIAASVHLGRDANRRAHWQDILDNLSEYPLQAWENKVTFRPDAVHDIMEALHYQGGARNTGVMFTTTFDNISHRTLPAYKLATCHTLDKGNMFHPQRWCGWQNGNDFGMMFVMAVRAGYRPDRVLEAIKKWKPEPNGVVSQKDGGGIETAGIIEAINNMLLQSHDGVIRVFPNWDRTRDAAFKGLRAVGAFLVGARYRSAAQTIDSVRIFSERGNPCALQSPFDGDCITVTRADNRQSVPVVQNEDEFTFNTESGVTYQISRADCPSPSAEAPVITAQPEDATVVLSETATFRVSATGQNLRYQWQKNRVDIPEATSPSYTSPKTTLWDIGSTYRCVVSDGSLATRSRPGTLRAKE
ncbi:MAG: immunoglobulin domain-containing protein [Verrucomicrobiales bacterium]|nr:immunoglobulin domain-containing protein [Verrucomicrobiales bacterium]